MNERYSSKTDNEPTYKQVNDQYSSAYRSNKPEEFPAVLVERNLKPGQSERQIQTARLLASDGNGGVTLGFVDPLDSKSYIKHVPIKEVSDARQEELAEELGSTRRSLGEVATLIEAPDFIKRDLERERAGKRMPISAPKGAVSRETRERRLSMTEQISQLDESDKAALEHFAQYAKWKRDAQLSGDGEGSMKYSGHAGAELKKMSRTAQSLAEGYARMTYGDENVAF